MVGIKNPDSRINAITTSIDIIMSWGIWLTLVRTPHGSRMKNISDTSSFLINEGIVSAQQKLYDSVIKTDSSESKLQFISDDTFRYSNTENKDVDALQALIKTYHLELDSTKTKLPTEYKTNSEEIIPFFSGTNLAVLQQLQQVQLMVLQNDM